MGRALISVKDLKKNYGKKSVLNGLSFDVEPGSIFALLGENGAGKTTTVRVLSTLIHPDSGTATIAGFDSKHQAYSIRKMISLTGQYAAVDELLTGEENLQMMGRLNHLDHHFVKARTKELLEQFDLVEAAKQPAKTYSGGMRRRLDIAIGLLSTPQILFLDEPTTGLDPRSRLNMWNLIQELANSGVTIFLTTQYLEEAERLADKIAVIDGGKIVAEGTADELKRIVGEEKLEIKFANPTMFQKAQTLFQGHSNASDLSIALTSDGSTEGLRQILNELHEHGIVADDIQFRKPTLDDVFLHLTNRSKGVAGQ
jgi:ABC-2 type transport system ATP-binding protein